MTNERKLVQKLGDCRGLTNKQIWEKFRVVYADQPEHELRKIHLKWVNLAAEFFGSERKH